MEQSARAWTVPDPRLLDGHGTASCRTCANLQKTAEQLLSDGQRYESVPIRVDGIQRFSGEGDKWVFDLTLTEPAAKIVDESGATVNSYKSRQLTRAIAVVWQGDRWLVDGISE
ncbi:hypothetical protein [Oryzobacter terrae]|uniref:hypothetical protein n=1 Tax=Oryzobacter terrae TaxID=1620385 RepID=UPI00366D6749